MRIYSRPFAAGMAERFTKAALLDILEQPAPENLSGSSRLSVLRGEQSLAPNDVVIEWNNPKDRSEETRSIISAEGWKLNLHRDDQDELYDLENDPFEFANQIDNPDCASRRDDLRSRLRKRREESGDH